MLPLLAAGNPYEHTWNTWAIELYSHVLHLDRIPFCKHYGITNAVVTMFVIAIVLLIVGIKAGAEAKRAQAENRAPRGIGAVVETVVLFVRDEILRPNMPHHYKSPWFIGLFSTIFFFILSCNLFGLLPQPFGKTATGTPWVNFAIAFGITYIVGIWGAGLYSHGVGFIAHIAPHAPFPVRWFILWPIEFAGLAVKPVALTIRLTANMTAGHIILAVLSGFIVHGAASLGAAVGGTASGIGFLAITGFEIAIAFIQAYIFTVLSSVFVGASLSHEH